MKLLCCPLSYKKDVYFVCDVRTRSRKASLITVLILSLAGLVLIANDGFSQIAQFNFPATSSLVVSAKDANVTVSDVSLSAGAIETNITTGAYFTNEPYVEETGGWTAVSQALAKNFQFTITAAAGYTFSITNISFNAYATATGPSGYGFAIGSTDVYSVNAPSAALVSVNQTVSGFTGLSSTTIKIQGWLNGSRTSTGAGAFRLDDVIVSGTVTAPCYPTTQAFGLSFSGITSSQQTLNFTRGNGSGGVLAIANPGMAATDPASGTTYTGNLSFGLGDLVGGGRAVYNNTAAGTATASSQTVTNLASETQYYYNFYEWNSVGTCYNLSPLAGNAWTLSAEPAAQPTVFSAATVGSSQIDLSFSAASTISSADGYIILGRSDGVTPTTSGIIDGMASAAWSLPSGTSIIANINNTTTNSFSHTPLTSTTSYCYLIIPYNWNGSNSETYNYYLDATILTSCATTLAAYEIGDYRTNPLFTNSYYCDSYVTDGLGNYPWQKWVGSWVDVTIAAEAPQALLVKPPTIYLTGSYIDFSAGGTYNNIVIEGSSTNVYSSNTVTGITVASGKTLDVKAGILTVSGKMNLDAAAMLHIYSNASFQISCLSADFIRNTTSVIEINDDGNFYVQSYLVNLWTGTEQFHKNSNIYIQAWDNNPLTYLIPTSTDVSTYLDDGFSACFGNLIIDMGSSANNQLFQLLPDGFSSNLTNHDLIFRTAAVASGFSVALYASGLTGYNTTIGRNFTIENTWVNKPISLLNSLGSATMSVKGNVENNSAYSAILKACESSLSGSAITVNIDGDLKLSNTGIFDFNSAASGTGTVTSKVNLKGDLSVSAGAELLTTYTNNNGVLNFTGTGDGSTPALTQSIDISSTAALRNRQINFVINPLPSTVPYVALARDFELGAKSTVTVKLAGTFDFGFVGTTANIVKIVPSAGSTKFTSDQGSILKISSPSGVIKNTATYGIATGNIQGISTTNRSYSTLATLWYTGKVNQATGDIINSSGSTTANGKIVIVELADNNTTLTPTVSFGVSNNTTLSATGGKLDIRKGQFTETTTAYIFPATGFTGGTLYLSQGTLYKVAKGSSTELLSNADLIPRMDGTAYAYNIQGTIELTGTGTNDAFQTLRGLRTYRAVKFSGANTFGTDFKNLSNTVTIDSAVIITNSVVDCIDGTGNPIPFVGTGGLNMNGGRLRLKALNNANPELTGTYTGSTYSLTGGLIEFYGSTAIQQQQIRGNYNNGLATIAYNNLEINAVAANYNPVIANAGNVDLNSSFIIQGTMNVNSPTVLRMDKGESISGVGVFNLNSGAGLLYGGTEGSVGSAIEGLEASGTSVDAGNIRTSFRNLSAGAIYGFVSPGNMPTGSGLPSTIAGLTVFKTSNTDQVILTNPITIAADGQLTLSNGQLTTTAAKLITMDATATLVGGTSNNSFINGPIKRNTNSTASYIFPVGKSNTNRYMTFTPTVNLGADFTGEYFMGTPPAGDLLGPSLQGVVNTEYWQLERGGSATTKGILALNYINPGAGQWSDGVGSAALNPITGCTVQITKRSAVAGLQPWYFTVPDVAAVGEYTPYATNAAINSREINSFSYFTLGYSFSTVLPLSLLTFNGWKQGNDNVFQWKVADSRGLAGFELQQSIDGNSFTTITTVNAGSQTVYGYLQEFPGKGFNYYRLLVKGTDGNHFYSKILVLKAVSAQTEILGLARSIIRSEAIVRVFSANNQKGEAVIVDLLGRVVSKRTIQLRMGANELQFATPTLSKGMYLLTINTGDKICRTLKFIKE